VRIDEVSPHKPSRILRQMPLRRVEELGRLQGGHDEQRPEAPEARSFGEDGRCLLEQAVSGKRPLGSPGRGQRHRE
jgi:hypothetical protein